jgi:hypothetical protein
LNDWPDLYIHTNFDSAANIDPTKLIRTAFIGAASGYFLAKMNADSLQQMLWVQSMRTVMLAREAVGRSRLLSEEEGNHLSDVYTEYASAADDSPSEFASAKGAVGFAQVARGGKAREAGGELLFKRKPTPKGPLAVFGYDYFADHAKAARIETPKLLSYEGLWGAGEECAYEVLNFSDGKRNAQEIRDAVSAEYGPVPLEMVVEYLKALEKVGVVEAVK